MPAPKEIIRMGVGYDSVFDRQTTEAITAMKEVNTAGDAGGSNAVYYVSIVKNYRELLSLCDISASATFKLGTLKGEVKTRFFESLKFNSRSVYLYGECLVRNPSRELDNPTLSTEAVELAKQDLTLFQKKYGDEFVYKHNRGGSIKVLYEFVNIRSERKNVVTAQVDVAKKFLNAGFKVSAKLRKSITEMEGDTRIRVYYFRNGDFEKVPGLTFKTLDKETREFVSNIKPGSGKDVVLSVETKPFTNTWNSPIELTNLPALADKGRDYVQALFTKSCDCQEQIGECRATLDNEEEYAPIYVQAAREILPRLEGQAQKLSDIYDNYLAKRVMSPSLREVMSMEIITYMPPEPVDGPFAKGFRFGKNALDNKIYLGEVNSPEDFVLKVAGGLRFLGDDPKPCYTVYPPERWVTAWTRDIYESRLVDPKGDRIAPIRFYFHDRETDELLFEKNYDLVEGNLISAGRYRIYVCINTKAELYTINAYFNRRWIMHEDSVITLDEGAGFHMIFEKRPVEEPMPA